MIYKTDNWIGRRSGDTYYQDIHRYWLDVDLESVRPRVSPHRLHHLQVGGGEALPRPQAGQHRQRAVGVVDGHSVLPKHYLPIHP